MEGIIPRESHQLYQTWRWIIRNHSPSGMVCEQWLDFWNFVEDVREKPETGTERCYFHRHYFDKPYGPGNWRWRVFEKTDETRKRRALYARQYRARKLAEDPFFHKHWTLKKQYGIGSKEYKEILERQNGVCAICGGKDSTVSPTTKKYRMLPVDHCHKTGKVRGILCSQCNIGIGSFKDDIERLKSAIRYLGGCIE